MSVCSGLPLAWWAETYWAIPVMGGAVCVLAYMVGRSFLPGKRPLPPPDPLAGAEDTFLKGVTRDRRAAPRRPGNLVEVLLTDGSDGPPVRAVVLDRSVGGLKLAVDDPVPVGAVLQVRATRASTSTPWLQIIVRSCRRVSDDFELGCQFPHTPSWSLLLQFG